MISGNLAPVREVRPVAFFGRSTDLPFRRLSPLLNYLRVSVHSRTKMPSPDPEACVARRYRSLE